MLNVGKTQIEKIPDPAGDLSLETPQLDPERRMTLGTPAYNSSVLEASFSVPASRACTLLAEPSPTPIIPVL
jgi:hypothetical protein